MEDSNIRDTGALEALLEQGYDSIQVDLLKENCILVDENDNILGSGSKLDCHRRENLDRGMLHRAFSVFLFNEKGELLLQQRSMQKITFPGLFTNTCCSHPLFVPEEICGVLGIKRASQRRLIQELGLHIPLDALDYITRIHYKAYSDDQWGEHEIDYVLVVKQNSPILDLNPNEVMSIRYISKSALIDLLDSDPQLFTPWFRLISRHFLLKWWDNINNLDPFKDIATIHPLKEP
jgi:isopentenyl-diphosphate delta-isomerase